MTTAQKELMENLVRHDCYSVRAVTVNIGRHAYYGATFAQKLQLSPGCKAYSEAMINRTSLEYIHSGIILLGNIVSKRSKYRTIFDRTTFSHDGGEWYVVCFATHEDREGIGLSNGKISFQIGKWSVPDGTKIDQYEETPYKRIPMTVKDTE